MGEPGSMYGRSGSGTAASGSGNPRYDHLTSRLRNRQITMEEATELFSLMQAMIARANEVARAAALRPASVIAAAGGPPPPPPARAPAAPGSSDDFLLVGLLAMGAGAGLLAALAKRLGDPSSPSPAGGGRSSPGAASR